MSGAAGAHHVEVPRTARYYTVGDAAAARAAWVVLHGYGQLAGYFIRHFAPLAEGRLVVAPEALSRFYLESREGDAGAHGRRIGATWMTREDRDAEMRDYVRYLDLALAAAALDVDWARTPLGVLGFSQGTATACRWLQARAARGVAPAARLVLWAGEVPPDLDLDAPWLRATRLTIVVGDADPYATPTYVAALRERLDAHGVAYELVPFAGGHQLDGPTLARIVDVPA